MQRPMAMAVSAVEDAVAHAEASDDEEEEERVVYYDPDDFERRARSLSATSERRLSDTNTKPRPVPPTKRIFEHPTQLFSAFGGPLGGLSGEEEDDQDADDGDASNPFAALLQSTPARDVEATPWRAVSPPPRRVTPPRAVDVVQSSKPQRVRVVSRSPPAPPSPPTRTSLLSSKAQSFRVDRAAASARSLMPTIEAADARPARWSRPGPSGTNSTKRRQSTSTGVHTKQQAEAKRRKSMPATFSSLNSDDRPTGSVGRRLSDVLSKATLLSQEKRPESTSVAFDADHSFVYAERVREVDDGIADTVHDMRDEPFQTQFFSPSKLRNAATTHRRVRPDALLTRIRGSLGDAIRKASRKTNRDLTLLRSQGQTLLACGDKASASDVHQREFVVVRLEAQRTHAQLLTFEGVIEHLSESGKRGKPPCAVEPTRGLKLTAVFTNVDSAQQLTRGSQVKVFAPFQIVSECFVPGGRQKRRKYLVGTSLFEVMTAEA